MTLTNEPFPSESILFRFTPTEEERGPHNGLYWDVAAEYAVEKHPTANCGIVVYFKNSRTGEWDCNPWNNRTIVARLLAERTALMAELHRSKEYHQQWESTANGLLKSLEEEIALKKEVEEERTALQAAFDTLNMNFETVVESQRVTIAGLLEQGKKDREET